MPITKMLKEWLVEHAGCKTDATDEEFRRAASEAMTRAEGETGFLSQAKLAELTADPDASRADRLDKTLDAIVAGQTKTTEVLGSMVDALAALKAPAAVVDKGASAAGGDNSGGGNDGGGAAAATLVAPDHVPKDVNGKAAGASEGGVTAPRVKGAHECYSTTTKEAYFPALSRKGTAHPFAGQRVSEGLGETKRFIDEPSELHRAASGAWMKDQMCRQMGNAPVPQQFRLNDHDKSLLAWTYENAKFGGVIGGVGSEDTDTISVMNRHLTPHEKALIDDAVSGGLEIAPIFFDDQVILTPLLFAELFGLVNLVNISRGRRIEGASIGNVTLAWGGGDDNAIAIFNTAAFVAAFDTTIFVVDGSVEVGLDFLSDSPINVANIITSTYGDRLAETLDTQIARGDGLTQPEGIMVAAGTTAVAFGGVAPTVGGYEQLLFAVPKQFKAGFASNRQVFCSNEVSYRRARAIAVGAADARRIFGMTHEDYMLFGHPYKIVTAMPNTEIFFANLARYRMYRRLGLVIRTTTEGTTLMRRNMWLFIARARFGGQIEDGNAAGVVTTAQA